jgi:hypothetical protein
MVESATVRLAPFLLEIPPPKSAELELMVEPVIVRVPSLAMPPPALFGRSPSVALPP